MISYITVFGMEIIQDRHGLRYVLILNHTAVKFNDPFGKDFYNLWLPVELATVLKFNFVQFKIVSIISRSNVDS